MRRAVRKVTCSANAKRGTKRSRVRSAEITVTKHSSCISISTLGCARAKGLRGKDTSGQSEDCLSNS
jgi:hypothetical protein